MPVTPTYPGVYLQEIDSGSRVITGVATSITAFVGRTQRGPTDEPFMCYNFGDFQRTFGPLTKNMPVSYAVQDFFNNGGGQALIVRLVATDGATAALPALPAPAPPAPAPAGGGAAPAPAPAPALAPPATGGPIRVMASSVGAWGNTLSVAFQTVDPKMATAIASRFPTQTLDSSKFAMILVGAPAAGKSTPSVVETIGPVYVDDTDITIRIDHALAAQSTLLRAETPTAGVTLPAVATAPGAGLTWTPLTLGSDGSALTAADFTGANSTGTPAGMHKLGADVFNILVIPGDMGVDTPQNDLLEIAGEAAALCSDHKAMFIAEPLPTWQAAATQGQFGDISPADLNIGELDQKRRVFAYFPMIRKLDPENGGREGVFSASGMIAGVFAATDVRRGVWKAPAGLEAGLSGVTSLTYRLNDMQNGVINQVGVNALRDFPITGKTIWGSRTLAGADVLSDDYKYVPVRRLTDYIEMSLYNGTKFAVFEPNTETLWGQLRLTINSFMANLNRQGAFYNYYVVCDKTTTTPLDIDLGIVNVTVAFAPVKPAEFVILSIQQLAGQTAA